MSGYAPYIPNATAEKGVAEGAIQAPPKPKAAVPSVGPTGFWNRIAQTGVGMLNKATLDTEKVAKGVGNFAKNTAVSAVKDVVSAGESTANAELRHMGSGELDNWIKGKFGANPVQGALQETGKQTVIPGVSSEQVIKNASVGQKINDFLGTPDTEQTIGNFFNTALLIGTAGASKGVELGGQFLMDQLGVKGVTELATKAGIDMTKTSIEDAATQLTKVPMGKQALKAISTDASTWVSRALKTGLKTAPVTAAFSGAQEMSDKGSPKQVAEQTGIGAAEGFVAGGAASTVKSGFRAATGKTAADTQIRAQAASHGANEKMADEKGLPSGTETKQIKSGSSTKQLNAGGDKAEGEGFTMSAKPSETALQKSSQINALQKRVTDFQTGKLKITPEEAKSDAVKLKSLKSGDTEAPKMTSLKTADKTETVKKGGLGESGSVNPGQAGKDVKDMIAKHGEATKFSKDLEESSAVVEGKKDLIKDDAAKIIKNRAQFTNAEKGELQKFRDDKAAGLTPKPLSSAKLVKEDADVTELNKASQAADAQRARNDGNEAKAKAIEAKDPSIYTHRVAQNKGGSYDYVAQGDKKSAFSRGLTKSKAGDKTRVMYNLTDENGGRHTVAIKNAAIKDSEGATVKRINKQVTEFTNKGETHRSVGSLNLKTNEDQMSKELAPVEKNIDNLTKEKQILSATKSRTEAASGRLKTIETKLSEAQDDKATILNKYDMNEMDGKSWKAPDGHTYTFGQATVDEIQKNSGQSYYVDPKLNAVANYVDSTTALENSKFVEQIKTSDKVGDFISKPGETAPPGFKAVPELPQFQGYKFDPKTADVLKDIAGSGQSEANVLNATGRFLRQTIVYFPVKHNINMLASYAVDRGLSKLASPPAYKRMVGSLYSAMDDVMHQTDFYQQVQKKGFTLMSSDNSELDKAFSSEIKNLVENKDVLDKVAQHVGSTPERLAAVYNKVQHTMVWEMQDVLNIARIRERMSDTMLTKGESLDAAIKSTQKYNLQYRVPSRVMGSRQIARGLKSDVVFFGTYRYDLYRTFTNILKSSVNVTDPKGAVAAWDKLAATAVGVALVMPHVDKLFADITGDKNAHMSAPGGLSVPADFAELLSGKEDIGAFANQNVYLSSGYTLPYEIALQNQNAFGEPIRTTGSSAKVQAGEVLDFLKSQLSPFQKASSVSSISGNKVTTWIKDMSLSLSGVSMPKDSPDLNKYYSLAYDQATPIYDQFRSQVQSGNTKEAISTANEYNNQLVVSLQKAYEDANPGKTITSAEVSRYIQGVYNSPWINIDSRSLESAKKPSTSILNKIK
jgi:hypothetical protein